MAGSLQDQLLKSGLTDAKKAKALDKEKRKQAKAVRRGSAAPDDEIKRAAQEAALARAERARALNAERDEAALRKSINAQIKQLINVYKEHRDSGDTDFNFSDGRHIKKIMITPKQKTKLIAGLLKIVKQGDRYELVPSPVADKIAQRDAERVIDCRGSNEPELTEEEKEWYRDYEIPDDLDW